MKRYSPELHQKLRKLWYATAQRAFDPDAARTRRAAFVGELRAGLERLTDSNCKTHRQLVELLNEGGHWTFAGARWTVESLRRYLKRHCPDLPEKLRVQRAADRAQAKAVLDGIARHRGINREPPLTEKDAAAELTRGPGSVISRNQIRKLSPRRRGREPFWNGERRAEVRALHQAGKTLDEIAWEYSGYGKPRNEIKRVLKEKLGPLLEGPKRVSASAPPPYLASWIEERCDRGWALRSLTSELYDDYLQWATAAGDIAVPVKRFSTELESLAVIRWRHPRTRRHGFAGIALKRCYEEQRSIPPPVVAQVTQKYLSGEESFAAWRDARCDLRSTLWSLTRELHEDFMQWTKEAGQFYFVSEKQFCDWFKNLRLDRRRDPQTRRHGFQGIALKTAQ